MHKITDSIVEKRNIILVLFIILTIVCITLIPKVNINKDLSKYLPSTSETKIGKDIMDSTFEEQKSSTLNVMYKGLSDKEKETKLEELKKVEGVSEVAYDDTEEYNNGEYTLYVLTVDDYDDSKTAENVYDTVKETNPTAMSGSISDEYKPVLKVWIIFLAIGIAMVILTLLSESYIEPWLYLISIGIAVFINKGTNVFFSSVSNITDSIVAILQLALSMDYSIMLSNRYRQEREHEQNKVKAMKSALYYSFKAISSSSITTVVGLLALVFMSFTIGRDLGVILAKGVFLSLVSIFFCLPGLLLLFDKWIIYSKKKSIQFNLTKIGKFSYKTRWVQLILIIALFVVSYFLKGNLSILYTGSQQDIVGKYFPETNQIAIIYENKYEDIIADYCKSIEDDEKANQVLCYSNTINEKLAYNELNDKFEELGQDTEIDNYLIKLIYYDYYNKNNNDSMTLNEFIKFIKSDVYTNDEISSLIDSDTKDNINQLENFSTKENVNKIRTASEIANILGIDEEEANELLIYYNSKNVDTKLTLSEFINFMLNDVANDTKYSSSIDKDTLASLKQLQPFTNKSTINKKMNSTELANLFGLDKSSVDQLFLLYKTQNKTDNTMTINEFATYALNLSTNENYSSMFDSETLTNLKLLRMLSDEDNITKEYSSKEMANLLGFSESDIALVYFYSYFLSNPTTDTKLSLNTFVNEIIMDENISSLLPSSISNYKTILTTFSNKDFITTKVDSTVMYNYLKSFGFTSEQVKAIYAGVYKQKVNQNATDEEAYSTNLQLLNPYEFLTIVKSTLDQTSSTYQQVNLLINIMDLSYNSNYNVVPTYTYQELTTYLSSIDSSIETKTLLLAYSYYDYKNNNTYKMSIKDTINFIVKNKDDELISSKVSDKLDLLTLTYTVVNNTSTKYSYTEMAKLTNESSDTIKSIYGLANEEEVSLTPKELAEFILANKDNELLKSKLNKDALTKLNLVNKAMTSTLNNTKYNAESLSKLLDSDEDTLSLVLSLYNSQYIKSNQTISLLDFTNFLLDDVMNNSKYKDLIDEDSKDKLTTVNSIMKNTNKGVKYNALDLYNILNKLTGDLDYNLLDIVYTYYGSENNYDNSWKLTVEEFVNYLNSDILTNKKYSDFIDNDMKKTITDAKESVDDAKKLLVGEKYSRAIINSKYKEESDETFEFIQNALDTIGKNKGVYIIGDSPMALDISKSFNDEMNLITILTMIFIFVVVAITFKDLLIPLILVLIIQCAVFVTMAILTLTGSHVYYISLLIVQAILMGATIDYAIVYTTYYKEARNKLNVQEAMIDAYNKSIHTILSSSSILIIVTLIVALFAEAIAAKICETVSEGTLVAVILIIFVLPGVLSTFDKFICRKNKKLSK